MSTSRSSKPPNGQANGGSYLLTFSLDDENQARAWDVAQQLASGRKLKQVLVGLLLAIHEVQERTGRQIDATEFMARFVSSMIEGEGVLYPSTFAPQSFSFEELPTAFVGTDNHIDPTEARQLFAGGIGNLFDDDDEDDLWD